MLCVYIYSSRWHCLIDRIRVNIGPNLTFFLAILIMLQTSVMFLGPFLSQVDNAFILHDYYHELQKQREVKCHGEDTCLGKWKSFNKN